MNTRILLLAISVAALSSCSSAYKSGQTPDDVYYSPARPQVQDDEEEYVEVRKDNNRRSQSQDSRYQTYDQYQDNYRDDRFLRMSIGNPYYLNSYNQYGGFDWRYNSFDAYNPYGYNGYGFNSPWNSYYAWNNFYNPYCTPSMFYLGGGGYGGFGGYGNGYYGNGAYYGGNGSGHIYSSYRTPAPISRPLSFNPNSYSNGSGNKPSKNGLNSNYSNNNSRARYNNTNSNNNRSSNNSNYNNSTNSRTESYSPSNSNSNSNSTSTPSRTYTPSSSSGSSSGGSSSGGSSGGVTRPGRGGR